MPTFNGKVAEFFHDHHGVASGDELTVLDISEHERLDLMRCGALLGVFEGVYRLASSPLTFHARCRAVCMADPSLTLSCFTAGSIFELRRCGNPWLHAMTNRLTKPVGPSVKVHRTTLDLTDRTIRRDDGIRHTDAVQTFFDLGKHVSDLTLRSIGEQLIADGLATYDEMADHAVAVGTKGRPGGARVLRVLGTRSAVGAAADSHGEVMLFEALRRAGQTELVRHPQVRLRTGEVVHPDMGDPTVGFYIEVDHHTWHTDSASVEYDKWRDREVRLAGGEVERVPTSHIEQSLPSVVTDLLQRYRQSQLRR